MSVQGTEAQGTSIDDSQYLAKGGYCETRRGPSSRKERPALGDVTNRNDSVAGAKKVPVEQKARLRPRKASQPHRQVVKKQDERPTDVSGMDVDACSTSRVQLWKDIDKGDNNPLSCALFAEDVMSNLFKAEETKRPLANYIETVQDGMVPYMRSVLVDWLVEVAQEYKLVSETLYLTVDYVDRYLSVVHTPRQQLQLVGVTCMLLASKYEEIYAPSVEDFCFITENTYTKAEVLQTERLALEALNFELTVPSIRVFLRRFIKAAALSTPPGKVDIRLDLLSSYLAELTLLDYDALHCFPSMIAAAAVFLAQYCLSGYGWNATMEHYTRYSAPQLRHCVALVHRNYLAARTSELPASREKYSKPPYGCVATLPPPLTLPQELFM